MRFIEHTQFIIRERVYAAGRRMARHAHDYSNITIVLNGEIEEAAESGRYCGRSCSVVLKPAGCEHEDRVGGRGARTLSIELKRGALGREVGGQAWSWFDQTDVVRAAMALHRAPAEESEARAWALLAAVLAVPRPDCSAPKWITAVMEIMEGRFEESLQLDALARDFGLHPVYLSRAFHKHVGTSLTEYLRAIRLRHARHLLASSRRSVTAIAAETGFYDASHFSHTFSRALNATPRMYRRLCREVQGIQVRTANDS